MLLTLLKEIVFPWLDNALFVRVVVNQCVKEMTFMNYNLLRKMVIQHMHFCMPFNN